MRTLPDLLARHGSSPPRSTVCRSTYRWSARVDLPQVVGYRPFESPPRQPPAARLDPDQAIAQLDLVHRRDGRHGRLPRRTNVARILRSPRLGRSLRSDDEVRYLWRSLVLTRQRLVGADMTVADVVRLNIYTTDVDALLQHFGVLAGRFGFSGQRFASSVLGVARLPSPQLLVMLEATAMD